MESFEIENPMHNKRDRNSMRRKKAPPSSVTSLPSDPPQLDQLDQSETSKDISKPNEPTELKKIKFLVPNDIYQNFSNMISEYLDHLTSLETSVADSEDLPRNW